MLAFLNQQGGTSPSVNLRSLICFLHVNVPVSVTDRLQLHDLGRYEWSFRAAQSTHYLTLSDERFPTPNAIPIFISKHHVLQTSLHLPVLNFNH